MCVLHPELHSWQQMLVFHVNYKIIINTYYVSFLLGLSIYLAVIYYSIRRWYGVEQ